MKLHKNCGKNDRYFPQLVSPVEIFPTETAVQEDVNIFGMLSLFTGEKGENIILLNEIEIFICPKIVKISLCTVQQRHTENVRALLLFLN